MSSFVLEFIILKCIFFTGVEFSFIYRHVMEGIAVDITPSRSVRYIFSHRFLLTQSVDDICGSLAIPVDIAPCLSLATFEILESPLECVWSFVMHYFPLHSHHAAGNSSCVLALDISNDCDQHASIEARSSNEITQ